MELNAYPETNLGYLSTVGSHLGDRPVMAEAVRVAIAEIERLRAYEKEWLAALDACSWMHDDKTLEIPLGRRLTVEGVAALRKQRDELRQNQFRWIPFNAKKPELPSDTIILLRNKSGTVWSGPVPDFAWQVENAPYWAPIPPLPERSQADRDDEMLRVWIKSLGAEHTDRENSLRIGYLEGLKAAREQKP